MYKSMKLAHLIKILNSLINCALNETSRSFCGLAFPFSYQHNSTSKFNSSTCSQFHTACLASMPVPVHFAVALISDVTTLVSASLRTLRTKRTHSSENSGVLGWWQCVVGRVLTQRKSGISQRARIQRNTAVWTTNLALSLQCHKTDTEVLWRPSCKDSSTSECTGTCH